MDDVLHHVRVVLPALAGLAIGGFAPGGHLPVLLLAVYACGLLAVLFSGRPPSGRTG
ncbi:hypothetical protein ABTY98_25395 [Streptomyces sp. NPDC096040]|uniref:hypothetical protein n=1 Tax=Streptomyces sp. NPDC096040 TaxID=3155541 RepID=UPI00331FF425